MAELFDLPEQMPDRDGRVFLATSAQVVAVGIKQCAGTWGRG